MSWPVVCATGHRTPPNRLWVEGKALAGARWLYEERGTRTAVTGLALGWDTVWAKAALSVGMQLWAFCPGRWQADPWPPQAKAEWSELRRAATRALDFGPSYADKWYHVRDQAMLDASQAVFVCYDPAVRSGGTYETVLKADRAGRPKVWLDPAAMVNHGVVDCVVQQQGALW